MVEKAIRQGGKITICKECRGAAAQIEGVKGAKSIFVDRDLFLERIEPVGNKRKGGYGIEITIRAFCSTERDVDI
ncbi:MAG: hypothetical protein BA872_01370 [Desulfobacterales bacterium C00003060]|nr:MAG: hypothetical protein BA872_01370 [Desulfobacterales bacterium C00003060]